MGRGAARKTWRSHVLVFGSLLVPLAVSIYLVKAISSHLYLSYEVATWVIANRALVQLIVQVLSMILGTCQIYTISAIIGKSTNIHLQWKGASLDTIKFLDALRKGRLDFDLPVASLAVLILSVAALQVPSALWAGAITPITTTTEVVAQFPIPNYSESTAQYWSASCAPATGCDDLVGNTSQLGTFTYIPWKTKTGLLLNSINQASSRNASVPRTQKLDNTGYTYDGRSYGVGSTIGLAELSLPVESYLGVTAFSYYEKGYISNVECIRNESSALSLYIMNLMDTPGGIYGPRGVWANGSLPNGDWFGFPSWGVVDDGTVLALAAQDTDQFLYGIISGHFYNTAPKSLNKTQCEVTFTPSLFEVSINVNSKIVSVNPQVGSNTSDVDLDPSREMVRTAFYGPSWVSQVLTTGYTSILGDAFSNNVDNVRAREGHVNATVSDTLTGVAEGLEIVLDGFLGSTGAAQLMLLNETQNAEATATVETMQLGEPKFAYPVLGISLLVLLFSIVEAIRTKFWKELPLFDSLDLKSAIIGTAAATLSSRQTLPESIANWDGNAGDRTVGRIHVVKHKAKPWLLINKKSPKSLPHTIRADKDAIPLLEIPRPT